MKKAMHVFVATFGGIIGLMGLEHAVGEILQGNIQQDGLFILSWPDSPFFRILSGEPAMTIVPNMLITGILAAIFSLMYFVGAVWYVDRKHIGLVLMILTIPMLLFGGGIFPPVLGVLIGFFASRARAMTTWTEKKFSEGLQNLLARVWPWAFAACLLSWFMMVPGVPVVSYYFSSVSDAYIFTILGCMFVFLVLTALAGMARDARVKTGMASGF